MLHVRNTLMRREIAPRLLENNEWTIYAISRL